MPHVADHPLAQDLDHILEFGEELWRRLSGERLFITGGTGFFGIWLLEALTWANDRLDLDLHATVLTRNPTTFASRAPHLASHAALTFQRGDVCNFDFPAGSFSRIIHAATEASEQLNREQPLRMFDTIVAGTRHTLEFAGQCGATDFLLTSSGAVYGPQPSDCLSLSEDYGGGPVPYSPLSAYAEGKRAAELLCGLWASASSLRPKLARCFAFIGPHLPMNAHFAIGNFLRDALSGKEIVVNGDGRAIRSYLHGADLVVWLLKILLDGTSNRPYNVGSDMAIDIAGLAQMVSAASGSRPSVRILRPPGSDAENRYVPDISRARGELNLDVYIPLDAAIARTLAWAGATGGRA